MWGGTSRHPYVCFCVWFLFGLRSWLAASQCWLPSLCALGLALRPVCACAPPWARGSWRWVPARACCVCLCSSRAICGNDVCAVHMCCSRVADVWFSSLRNTAANNSTTHPALLCNHAPQRYPPKTDPGDRVVVECMIHTRSLSTCAHPRRTRGPEPSITQHLVQL